MKSKIVEHKTFVLRNQISVAHRRYDRTDDILKNADSKPVISVSSSKRYESMKFAREISREIAREREKTDLQDWKIACEREKPDFSKMSPKEIKIDSEVPCQSK